MGDRKKTPAGIMIFLAVILIQAHGIIFVILNGMILDIIQPQERVLQKRLVCTMLMV